MPGKELLFDFIERRQHVPLEPRNWREASSRRSDLPTITPSPPHSQPLPWRPQAGISLRYPPFWRYFGLFFLPSTRGVPFCFCLPNPAVFLKKRCNTYQCISLNLHGINASKKTSNVVFCTRPPLFLIFIGLVLKMKGSLIWYIRSKLFVNWKQNTTFEVFFDVDPIF